VTLFSQTIVLKKNSNSYITVPLKKYLFSLLMVFACHVGLNATVPAQSGEGSVKTRVTGHIKGQKNPVCVILEDAEAGEISSDNVHPVKDGRFDFTIDISRVSSLIIADKKYFQALNSGNQPAEKNGLQMMLMPGEDAELSGTWKDFTVKGSAFYEDYNKVQTFLDDLYNNLKEENYQEVMTENKRKILDYIRQHPKQEAAMLILGMFQDKEDFVEALNLFDESVREGRMLAFYRPMLQQLETMEARREAAAKIVEGAEAPDFTLPDLKGNALRLSSLRGQYVILDFWGSWCHWCTIGMRDMRKYYKKYAGKFEILGVDCNDTEENWKAAVKQYRIKWLHVRQSKDTEKATDLYGIDGFPTKIIIGPEGRIVKVFSGEDPEFYRFLESLFE